MILDSVSGIITVCFLCIILSYYVLLFMKQKPPLAHRVLKSISIIIPAHNEEPFLRETLKAVIAAKFKGTKEIIVIDDASKDKTNTIARSFTAVKLLENKKQLGKSASINRALALATGAYIAIVDADSIIGVNSLENMAKELSRRGVVGVTGPILVNNRNHLINFWVHIEQLYNSLMRLLLSKINANVVTPGPLSMYKRSALSDIGGFSSDGFSEDIDISIRLIRAGHKIGYCSTSISRTNMPHQAKWFLRQRIRFARGMLHIFKRHLTFKRTIIDLYTLPIFFFGYIQAVIMGSFTMYQIISGYINYFAASGQYFNWQVISFFFNWFSIIGFIRWAGDVLLGNIPLTFITVVGIVSTLLTYPLYFVAIFKFERRFDWRHAIALFFMAPFWWLIMIVYILVLPELFMREQHNIWKKNE